MIVPAKDLSSPFWGFLWVLFSNPNRVSQSRSSWGYSLTRLGRRALETVGSSHLSHILQHSHPGQLLLDQPKVVNFLSKLGTVSSMIHLEEDTCVPQKKKKIFKKKKERPFHSTNGFHVIRWTSGELPSLPSLGDRRIWKQVAKQLLVKRSCE